MKKRSYHQFCGLAKALDILGERWTLLIVRDLLLGPRRYSDLIAGLPGITTNLLANRLKSMEQSGLVKKGKMPPPVSVTAYTLTEKGLALEPVLMALGRWGESYAMGDVEENDIMNIGWAMVALKRRYRGIHRHFFIELHIAITGLTEEIQEIEEEKVKTRIFQLELGGERLGVQEGWFASSSSMKIKGEERAFRRLFYARHDPKMLRETGILEIDGDEDTWKDFCTAFGLGEKPE